MPAPIEIPFAIQKGDGGPTQNSRERLINLYAEIVVSGKSSKIIRRQRPGLTNVQALAGEKRCIVEHVDGHYLIVGTTLYRFANATLTTLGTIGTASGLCTMVFNDNDQILISDEAKLYYYNGTTVAPVTVPAGFVPGTVAYVGGFGVVNDTSTNGRFYWTPANDFSQIDALDFATAESTHDPLLRVFADHNELWLSGTTTTEIWSLTGGADAPFTPLTTAKLERGTAAPMSFAGEDNTVLFLGNDGLVYRGEGYRPVVVSTGPVATRLAALRAYWSTAYAFTFTWNNLKFYVLTIPGYATLVLNLASGLWHEHASYLLDYWLPLGGYGRTTRYYLTPTGIAELSTALTDEGGIMVRRAVSAPGWANGLPMTMSMFQADCQIGRAPINTNATLMLRVALDGETFGNIRTVSLGATGEYTKRALWRDLGQGTSPVIELSMSDAAELSIMSTLAEVEIDDA